MQGPLGSFSVHGRDPRWVDRILTNVNVPAPALHVPRSRSRVAQLPGGTGLVKKSRRVRRRRTRNYGTTITSRRRARPRMCKTDEHESLRLILDPSECAVDLHVKRKVNGRHGPEAVARSLSMIRTIRSARAPH